MNRMRFTLALVALACLPFTGYVLGVFHGHQDMARVFRDAMDTARLWQKNSEAFEALAKHNLETANECLQVRTAAWAPLTSATAKTSLDHKTCSMVIGTHTFTWLNSDPVCSVTQIRPGVEVTIDPPATPTGAHIK